MAKPLQLSGSNRHVGNTVRTWLAVRQQKRRRQRSLGGAVAPAVSLSFVELQYVDQGSWSPVLNVEVLGELPAGFVVRLYRQLQEVGPFVFRGTMGASGVFADQFGMPAGNTTTYRARAGNVDESVVGPWSEDVFIDSP